MTSISHKTNPRNHCMMGFLQPHLFMPSTISSLHIYIYIYIFFTLYVISSAYDKDKIKLSSKMRYKIFTYRIKLSSKTRCKTFTYRNNKRLLQLKRFILSLIIENRMSQILHHEKFSPWFGSNGEIIVMKERI